MAKTKQFTISVENRPGAVAGIARALGDAKVNILALLGTAPGAGGSIELVVDDARRARKALDASRISFRVTSAEECALPTKPGALADGLDNFAARGVSLTA